MISLADLERAIKTFRYPPDTDQMKVMTPAPSAPLFIVAGPGTGKTTSLTFRILKLVLVDRVPPKGIIATTFTKKAAEELRSRVLGWGFQILDALLTDPTLAPAKKDWLKTVDINQVWTGTVDSLCEELLRRYRAPGTQPPILVDDFVSKTVMLRCGLFEKKRHEDTDLDPFLLGLHSSTNNRYGYYAGRKTALLQSLWERRHQDLVNWKKFVTKSPKTEKTGRQVVGDALDAYTAELDKRLMVDFSLLEYEVLRRLQNGQLSEFTKDLKVILVDEYQDSNLMQEQIYFEFAAACKGALCVVGDDDQSLYRFRGATVDLFRNFPDRYKARFKSKPKPIFLTFNYRSTRSIIQFVNQYATLDSGYQQVRVAKKPALQPGPNAVAGVPVLGLFRDTVDVLATDLAQLLHQVFRGPGVTIAGHKIHANPKGGDIGDCALLCSSPAEYSKGGRERLPRHLRRELETIKSDIKLFNPRGEDITAIPIVQIFGGLLLECLDPGAALQGTASGISNEARDIMDDWRAIAIDFVNSSRAPVGLLDYASGWVDRDPRRKGYKWPRSVPVIELMYGLVHYLPELHDDPEGQIYLEVFTRQLTAREQVGAFGAEVIHDPTNQKLGEASIRELLRDFLAPIAEGLVGVNEELMDTFPRDRLCVLSVHQSKGLEFPVTIVDIGSDFKTNHRAHTFKRFPTEGGPPHRMEDLLRPHSALGKETRPQVDRAFDDLFRQFFVAFSRPQDLLLLVGLTNGGPSGAIKNVAAGWDRTGTAHWQGSQCPLTLI